MQLVQTLPDVSLFKSPKKFKHHIFYHLLPMIGEVTNKKDESKVSTITSAANCIALSLHESSLVTRVNVAMYVSANRGYVKTHYIET